MKRSTCNQVQDLASTPNTPFDAKTKYVTAVIFEREGKTVLQPLITEQEAKTIQEKTGIPTVATTDGMHVSVKESIQVDPKKGRDAELGRFTKTSNS